MDGRFAFTAKYWGDSAVVCRAVEGRAGPIVDQEFGQFLTWTQAHEFAARLNDGLEIPSDEARQLITGSILRASGLLSTLDSAECVGAPLRGSVTGRPIRVQFMLAELDLAITFCRIARFRLGKHADRMLQNARKAFFDAMHYLCHSHISARDVDAITARLETLQAAFQESSPQHENPLLGASVNATALDADKTAASESPGRSCNL